MPDSGPTGPPDTDDSVPYAPPMGPPPKEPFGLVSAQALSAYERAGAAWSDRAERRLAFVRERGVWVTALRDLGRAFSLLSGDRQVA